MSIEQAVICNKRMAACFFRRREEKGRLSAKNAAATDSCAIAGDRNRLFSVECGHLIQGVNDMLTTTIFGLVALVVYLPVIGFLVYLAVQVVKALRKYNRSGETRREKVESRRSLGEVLKGHRVRCKMTQEFVAESLGVSRQAVSKWETGTADPSTSNLLALAKLFGVSAEELPRSVEASGGENSGETGQTP